MVRDEYLRRLAEIDPVFADELAADPALAAGLDEQAHRLNQGAAPPAQPEFITRDEFASALRIVGDVIDETRAEIEREVRTLKRRTRLRRWSRAEIDRYVMSKKGLPETAFKSDGK